VSVCPVSALTFENVDLETSFIVRSYFLRISTGWLKIKYPTGEYAISPQSATIGRILKILEAA